MPASQFGKKKKKKNNKMGKVILPVSWDCCEYLIHSFRYSLIPFLFISQQSCQWESASYFIREEKQSRSPSNEANHSGSCPDHLSQNPVFLTTLSILFIYGGKWVRRREIITTKPSPGLAVSFFKNANLSSIEILFYTYKIKLSKIDYVFNKNKIYGLLMIDQLPPSIQFLLQPAALGMGARALGKHVSLSKAGGRFVTVAFG